MIPKGLITGEIEIKTQPDLQHKMNIEKEFIAGRCDGKEALKQTIYKILLTERYDYVIYSRNYGVELKDLFGRQVKEVLPLIESRIREALLQDDRITEVNDFSFDTSKRHAVAVSFTVRSVLGDIDVTKEVQI